MNLQIYQFSLQNFFIFFGSCELYQPCKWSYWALGLEYWWFRTLLNLYLRIYSLGSDGNKKLMNSIILTISKKKKKVMRGLHVLPVPWLWSFFFYCMPWMKAYHWKTSQKVFFFGWVLWLVFYYLLFIKNRKR